MARDEFDNAGSYVAIKDLEGELIMFTPREYLDQVETSFGTKDAVVTDLVVLSQPGQPEHYDVMVFQGSLIAALKRRITVTESMDRNAETGVVTEYETTTVKRVLGVLGKGDAKKGQNAPFVLGPANDAQLELARAWNASNPLPEPVVKMTGQRIDVGLAGVVHVDAATGSATPVSGPFAGASVQDEFVPRTQPVVPADADEDPFAA